MSQHLKILKDAGLVAEHAEGTRRIYQLNEAGLSALRDQLDTFWNRALAGYQDVIERHGPGWEGVRDVDDDAGWTLYLDRCADLVKASA